MMRYSSSRSNKLFKVGSLAIALVGAFSFTGVVHSLGHARHAMAHNPVASTVLIVGILLILFSFRDTFLAPFGWMSPTRAERLIKGYLETQHYGITRNSAPPNFVLVAQDDATRKFAITWQTTPYVSVFISASWGVGDELSTVWSTATPAELRSLTTRLMEVGTRLEGGGAVLENLGDADKASIFYGTRIPRDLLNYEEFFRRLTAVEGCLIMAINLTTDLLETLKERQAAIALLALPPGDSH